MSDSFNPYYRWLAIPAAEQPPDLYRLLGVQLFEPDPTVIELAADARMASLRNYQAGQHKRQCQELLTEVSQARITLLSQERRTVYDTELRQHIEQVEAEEKTKQPPPLPTAKPPTVEPPVSKHAMDSPTANGSIPPLPPARSNTASHQSAPSLKLDVTDSRKHRHTPQNRIRSKALILISAILTAGLMFVIGYYLVNVLKQPAAPATELNSENQNQNLSDEQKIQWKLAGKYPATTESVSVRIKRVYYDTVHGRAARKRYDSGNQRFVHIYFEIQNKGSAREYQSWYSEEHEVILVDEEGERLPMMLFENVDKIEGQASPRQTIERGTEIEDVLIFELPASQQLSDIGTLYLTLPGESVGTKTNFHFKIPPNIFAEWDRNRKEL